MMMLVYIKQHLSNIWSSIHEKVKPHWVWGKKSVAYKKKMYSKNNRFLFLQKIFFVVMYNDESFKA